MVQAGFDAGSIFIGFKASLENLRAGFTTTRRGLEEFGRGVKTTAKGVADSGGRMAGAFSDIDKEATKASTRFAKLSTRLIAMQFALATVGNSAQQNLGKFKKATEAATSGLQTFTTVALLLPGKTGLALGAIAGLGVGLAKLVAPSPEAIAALDNANKLTNDVNRSINALAVSMRQAAVVSEFFNSSIGEKSAANLQIFQAELVRVLKELDELPEKMADVAHAIENTSGGEQANLKLQLSSLQRLQDNLNLRLRDIKGALPDKQAAAQIGAATDEVNKMSKSLRDLAEVNKRAEGFKLQNTAESAAQELAIAEQNLRKVLEIRQQLTELENDPRISKENKARIQEKLDNSNLSVFIEDVRIKKQALQEAVRPEEFKSTFATPFADAIGSGVQDGILQGKSSMETLAGVGQNLFSNFLGQSVAQFQTLMIDALTAVAGQGGGILGNLFTGVAGVLGLLLSKRSGSSSQSFAELNQVTATEQTRGIVAGPSSVAIASVAQNLRSAMGGVESRLDSLIAVSIQIRNRIGGTPGLSGVPFAGSVPTS